MMAAPIDHECHIHGNSLQRGKCGDCNAAYMRRYLRKRRLERPEKELLSRAQKRAKKLGIPFELEIDDITIPPRCPAIGIPLTVGGGRTASSPSLDRIIPSLGYVQGNVRVISDRANRLKGSCNLEELRQRCTKGPPELGQEYAAIVTYLERELVLASARQHSFERGPKARDWSSVVKILSQLCILGPQIHA